MIPGVEAVLAAIEGSPGVELDIDEAQGSAGVRVGNRVVGRIDLRRREALVISPADTLPTLQRAFPSGRLTANGLVFDLDDPGSDSAAVAAIRRRVNVERRAWQFREQSP